MTVELAAILLGRSRLPGQDALSPAVAVHEFAGSAGLFGIRRACEFGRCCERALHAVSPDAARLGDLLVRALEDTQPPLRERRQALAGAQSAAGDGASPVAPRNNPPAPALVPLFSLAAR